MENIRSGFRKVNQQTSLSATEGGHVERVGKKPGQIIIGVFIFSFTCLVQNLEQAEDNAQAMQDFMANLQQLGSEEGHSVKLPLLADHVSHVSS